MRNLRILYALALGIAAGSAHAQERIKKSEIAPAVSYSVHVFDAGKLTEDRTYHDFGKEGQLNMICRKEGYMLQPACTVLDGAETGGVKVYVPQGTERVPFSSDEGRKLQKEFEDVKSRYDKKKKD